MSGRETPFIFRIGADAVVGILHEGGDTARRGIVMIVGGPQYRVGGHRHYVTMARRLADAGIPVLRYDYRGIGDSMGRFRGFEDLDEDIGAGVDAMAERVPGLKEVVLWGLCESASAIAMYCRRDSRVAGVILANPYVSTVGGRARTMLRHYYLRRLFSRDLWRSLLVGRLKLGSSLGSLAAHVFAAGRGGDMPAQVAVDGDAGDAYRDLQIRPPDRHEAVPLPDRMAAALEQFDGRVLFVLSGDDLTAQEFVAAARSRRWSRILGRDTTARLDVAEADHTFSRADWLDQVIAGSRSWMASW